MNIKDNIFGLTKLYTEAKYNFAFFNAIKIDLDEEYKKSLDIVINCEDEYSYFNELKRFVALLKNGHSNVEYPKEIYENPNLGFLPILIQYINGSFYVYNCSKEYQDKITMYSQITRINHLSTEEYLQRYIFPYVWHETEGAMRHVIGFLQFGKVSEKLEMEFQYRNQKYSCVFIRVPKKDMADDFWSYQEKWIKTIQNLKLLYKSSEYGYQILEKDDIGILRVNTFTINEMARDLFQHSHLLKEKAKIIIDLRRNGGGNTSNAYDLLSMFTDQPFRISRELRRIHYPGYKGSISYNIEKLGIKSYQEFREQYGENNEAKIYYDVYNDCYCEDTEWPEKWYYKEFGNIFKQKVYVFIGPNTVSACEDFLIAFKGLKRGLICGRNSCGSTGQPLLLQLPYGSEARICTMHCIDFNGNEFDNIGIKPDIYVEDKIEDYLEHEEYIEDKLFTKVYNLIRKNEI